MTLMTREMLNGLSLNYGKKYVQIQESLLKLSQNIVHVPGDGFCSFHCIMNSVLSQCSVE